MISIWSLHLLDGLGHYFIRLGAVSHILVMTNNIMTLVYTYSKFRLKKPSDSFYKIAHTGQIIAWTSSR